MQKVLAGQKAKAEAESFEEMEISAARAFVKSSEVFKERFKIRHLEQALLRSIEKGKILLLYLHKSTDKFGQFFEEIIISSKVMKITCNFLFLGWDLNQEKYHPALIDALSQYDELSPCVNFIKSKTSAAFLIVPATNLFILMHTITGEVSEKEFLGLLNTTKIICEKLKQTEKILGVGEQSKSDIRSTSSFQQEMLNLMENRDYGKFDGSEFDLLKKNIGYALYGPPQSENGYDKKDQMEEINFLFKIILEQSSQFAHCGNQVRMSVVYTCMEPIADEKQKLSKKYENYDPKADFTPTPVFVLPKCENSKNPCRIFIDKRGRVYESWNGYLENNKLPECEMVAPLNGRYQSDKNGNVILKRHLSPACDISSKILLGTDIVGAVTGLGSGGAFLATAATVVAPAALATATIAGIGASLYSLGRSSYVIHDRRIHKESLSFLNSEARGAYLNIMGSSVGLLSVGANLAVSQMAAQGIEIAEGAKDAVTLLTATNVAVGGINIANSTVDVLDKLIKGQRPSPLAIVQLSCSILFFGHGMYNFKLAKQVMAASTVTSSTVAALANISGSAEESPSLSNLESFGGIATFSENLLRFVINANRDKILNTASLLMGKLTHISLYPHFKKLLNEIFPGCDTFHIFSQIVTSFFQKVIHTKEKKYQEWVTTKDSALEEPLFSKWNSNKTERQKEIWKFIIEVYFKSGYLTEPAFKELLNYFYTWLAEKLVQRTNMEKQEASGNNKIKTTKKLCAICKGEYYQ